MRDIRFKKAFVEIHLATETRFQEATDFQETIFRAEDTETLQAHRDFIREIFVHAFTEDNYINCAVVTSEGHQNIERVEDLPYPGETPFILYMEDFDEEGVYSMRFNYKTILVDPQEIK